MIPNGNPPEISLVFVNFRSAQMLSQALRSLSNDFGAGFIDGVVVNNDTEEEKEILEICRSYNLRTVSMPENPGFGSASNRGASLSEAGIIGFVNPDTELVQGSLREIAAIFRSDRNIGIVGASLVDPSGTPERWSAGKPASLFRILLSNTGFDDGIPMRIDRPYGMGFVSGAALFIKRDLFRELEGFDERFFLYFEDMDLCVRARRLGAKVVSVPAPVFRHAGGRSRESEICQKREFYVSQDLYFRKHRPKWEGLLLRLFRRMFVRQRGSRS